MYYFFLRIGRDMELIYGMIDMLGMIICFFCCVSVLQEKASNNQKNLLMAYICGFLSAIANALEFYAYSEEMAITAVKIGYIGKAFIMIFILLFVAGFSKIKISQYLIRVFTIFNIVLIGAIFCSHDTVCFYSSITHKVLENGRIVLLLGKGILYYAWILEILFCLIFYGGIVVYEFVRTPKEMEKVRLRLLLLIMSAIAPIIMILMFGFSNVLENFDPTTLAIVIAEVLILIDVKMYGLLDTIQLAKERVLEDTKDGLVVVDRKKKEVLYSNPMAKNLLPEIDSEDPQNAIECIFMNDENVFEQDGRYYEIRLSEIKGTGRDDIQGYLAWIFDMTFINQYTNEMIRLKEESEQASLAKTNFLAHMSHEIRTPMNAIVGYADLAVRNDDMNQIKSYLKNIKMASHTLLHLINEILDITKIETGKMELININYRFDSLMEELRSMLGEQAGKAGLTLRMVIDEKIPRCLFGDKAKMQEILTNLINNAIKYTVEGSITVRVFQEERTEQHVMLCMEVEDTGIGIEEKNFDKVFGKFEQFDKKRNYQIEGSGLGLSIVKSFVEMMDGSITFESEYEKGTKFIIHLWQGIGDERKDKSDKKENEEVVINRGSVLVVDDNELNRDVAQGILNILGIEADTISSGKNCVALLQAGKQYDIIFMDHMMPDMDGVESLHAIRKMGGIFKELPIVLLTANAVSGVKDEMIGEGFDDFLSKPIDIEELQRVLIRFLGTKE